MSAAQPAAWSNAMRTCPQCAKPCDETHQFCPSCGFPVGKVAMSGDDPLIGRTLPGGYVILDLVGIGGMGRVYRAEQTNLGRTVAVKIIHPHLIGEESAGARFITEARAASRLNHPHSVGIIDFGKTADGQLYLVMEFLRGRDLGRVAYDEGPLPFRRVVNILRQTLEALSEAHSGEIVHRDLKPENIILEPVRSGGDFVKVVDFGLAKIRAESQGPSITSPGIVCGTPEYMSPEQARGDVLDARSDLYAVGVILFQLLTGKLPFEGESATQVVLLHLTESPKDPRIVAPERQIPQPLVDVTVRALAKEPADRYQDADEFARALVEALAKIEARGSLRSDTAAALRCTACGALNPESQKFCGECGAPTGSTTPSVLPPPRTPVPPAPGLRRSSHPPAQGKSSGWLSTFVGREEDLAWLDARRLASRSLTGARVVGEIGVGKSTLVREFAKRAIAEGDVVVETGPDPTWAEIAYWGVKRAIVQLAALPTGGGEQRDWLGASPEARRGLSDVFGRSAGERAAVLTPEERRFATAEALRWALGRASERARGRRVILSVEDLHCIDGASRNAFQDALSDPPLVPALLVASHSPGFDPGWPADVAQARVIAGLGASDAARVVGGGALLPFDWDRPLAPLYVEHFLLLQREAPGYPATGLADVITTRIERLPAEARRVLQAAAVWGDDGDDELLTRMLGDEIDLVEALGFLRRARMLVVEGGPIRTTHPLIREVTLATIPAAVRRELHAAAAAVCDDRDMPLEVRALHEFWGGAAFQALLLLERVSIAASARGDHHGTVMALRRALELARRELFRGELDDPMRAVLIFSRKLGEALARAGQLNDAEGVLREALDVAPSGADRASVLAALAHVANGRERKQEARDYLRQALELASKSGARELVTSLETLRRAIA
jgi:serine/threonine-protein kinase